MRIPIDFRNDLPIDTPEQRGFYARAVRDRFGYYITAREISDYLHIVARYRARKAAYAPRLNVTFDWDGGHRAGTFEGPTAVIDYYTYLVSTFPGCHTSMVIASSEEKPE